MDKPEPSPARAAGQRIGRYRLVECLGRGAQGVVYLARDPELDRQVAIKTLPSGTAPLEALRNEARVVGALRHPNIVPVFDIGLHGRVPYVVYEHVPGRSLREVLAAEGPLAPQRAVEWTREVLRALAFAHARDIVHGALVPSSIRIGADATVRLMDFGLSTVAGPGGAARHLAPELVAGEPPGPCTDIFAAGLVLYEMLVGAPAPLEAAPAAAAHGGSPCAVDAPSRHRAEVDPDLDPIVLRATAPARAERFASAEEMDAALSAWLGGRTERGAGLGRDTTMRFLLRRMRRRAYFPAVSRHISEISRKSSEGNASTAADVSNAILKDYALTTKLLRLVNSPLYRQYGGKISTVSRAVVILGFGQVRMAALSLLLFEHMADGEQARALREQAGRSLVSGAIGRQLGGPAGSKEGEEAFICAMLHALGRHLTIYYLPEEHREIQRAVASGQADEATACRAVLGLGYEELAMGVAREWQLPGEIVDTLAPLPPGTLDAPRDAKEQRRHVAAFANEMCEGVLCAPPEQRAEALQALARRFGRSVPLGERQMEKVVGAALADARVYAEIMPGDLAATEAFRAASRWSDGGEPAPAPAAEPGPERPAPAAQAAAPANCAGPQERQGILLAGIQEITNAMLEGCPLNELLVMVLETAYRGLGATRTLLCIMDRARGRMVARFGLGQDMDTLLARFQFPAAGAGDLFSVAVREQADVVCENAAAEGARVPQWYRETVGAPRFVLMPLVVNRVCIGAVYCDFAETAGRLDAGQIKYLNTLRNQAALAIKQSS